MKLWIDDVRPAPGDMFHEWVWCKTVQIAKDLIEIHEKDGCPFELIDLDHDAGTFGPPDYIEVLNWLEETGRSYPIRIHSMNPVGVTNMRRIIQKNGWVEVR